MVDKVISILEIDSVHIANHLRRYVNLTQRLKYADSCNLITFFIELAIKKLLGYVMKLNETFGGFLDEYSDSELWMNIRKA